MDQQFDSNGFLVGRLGTKWTRWVAGLGALAALSSGAGGGQAVALEAEQILSYNLGKFLIQPQLDASAQFTGNLFYGADNPQPGGLVTIDRTLNGVTVPVEILSAPGRPVESDLLWYVSPGMEIQYGKNPENSLSLGYFHDFIFYDNNSDFNSGQDRVLFNARLELGRFTVVGTDSIQWLDTILSGNTQTVQRVPIRRLAWNDNYRVNYDFSMKTDFYTVFNHDLIDYLQAVNLYDQGTLRGTIGTTYKPSERIGIFVEGQGGHTDIASNLAIQAPGEDSWVYGGFVGARGTFTPRITGSIKVGYETREFSGLDSEGDGGGPAVGMALTYTPTQRLLLNLAYDRRVGVSPQFSAQSYTYSLLSLTANQQIGSRGRWSVLGRLGLNFGTYSDVASSGVGLVNGVTPVRFATDTGRDDQTYSASVGVVYQPRPWLTSSLTYSFEKYQTEFNDQYTALTTGLNDYVANRVILQVAIGY